MAAALDENARHQVVFRQVNEHIAELSPARTKTDASVFICECSDTDCAEPLEITHEEYEHVRADGARFAVLPGHQLPEVETVVGGNDRFLIVEKLGEAATVARTADLRRRG